MADRAEVVVVGGGPGGLGAAIAAAEEGADVLLIERYGFLGGMATAGMVNPFMPWFAGGEPIVRGVFERLLARLTEMGALGGPHRTTHCFDYEQLKILADRMVAEAGVRLRLHSFLADVEAADGRVRRIAVAGKSGLEAVEGDLFIDSTGDGDLCAWAGCRVEKGRPEDGLCQPMALNFRMGGVDIEAMPERAEINAATTPPRSAGGRQPARERAVLLHTREDEVHFNTTRVVMLDGTDSEALTEAELTGRRQVAQMVDFLVAHLPGFESAFLLSMGPQIGIRETRRVIGDHVLTTDEVLAAAKFEDGIARGSYGVDIHNPAGTGTEIRHLPPGEAYDIPYRCLTPLGFDNLLVAARCISSDHGAHSSLRISDP